MKTMTHTGRMEGYGSYGNSQCYMVFLRETKKFWVTGNGVKYRKSDGLRAASFSMSDYRLVLETIVEHTPIPHRP